MDGRAPGAQISSNSEDKMYGEASRIDNTATRHWRFRVTTRKSTTAADDTEIDYGEKAGCAKAILLSTYTENLCNAPCRDLG